MKLVEIEPGRFVIERQRTPPARSALPCPYVISDIMAETEHVDGRFYTSKSKFRSVTKAHDLIEVGNEKLKPKIRSTDLLETKQSRRATLKTALEKYKSGHRARRDP